MKFSFTTETSRSRSPWLQGELSKLLLLACSAALFSSGVVIAEDDGKDASEDPSSIASIINTEAGPRTEVVGGRFNIPAITPRSTSTDEVGNGSVPESFRSKQPRQVAPLPESAMDRGLADTDAPWDWSIIRWSAANTFSNPRYFEDRMLERHGHERWGYLQPLASGARFFSTLPMLPYKMAIRHPCECEYTLGYYRPGSCAPLVYQRPPWDRRAILAESAALATGMLIVP